MFLKKPVLHHDRSGLVPFDFARIVGIPHFQCDSIPLPKSPIRVRLCGDRKALEVPAAALHRPLRNQQNEMSPIWEFMTHPE